MKAVFKREIKAYFISPLGFVFIAAVAFFSGYYFFSYNIYQASTNMNALFQQMFSVVMFLIPILTMRLMSEERRQRTDQILLSAPIRRSGIVLGKYFAALAIYSTAISSTLVATAIMSFFARPDWPVVQGNFLGLLLMGSTVIAICLLLSSVTESQVIAAVLGFVTCMFLVLTDSLALVIKTEMLRIILRYISFNSRYLPFTLGVIELPNVVFFTSITVFIIYITILLLEKRTGN